MIWIAEFFAAVFGVLITLEYLIGVNNIITYLKHNKLSKLREDLHDFVNCTNVFNEGDVNYDEIYPNPWKDVGKVFPSDEITIFVQDDKEYGGAHSYRVKHSLGFNNGKADYVGFYTDIDFVKKNDDGKMEDGVQSEQLAIVLLDRAVKLNKRFPSSQNEAMIAGLNMFLDACRERVQERIDRGVMGKLTK